MHECQKEVDDDIDGPDHTKDYLDLWREHHPHHIGIHDVNSSDDAGGDENIRDT